jgi:uncharacterized protein (TIGR03435 family)
MLQTCVDSFPSGCQLRSIFRWGPAVFVGLLLLATVPLGAWGQADSSRSGSEKILDFEVASIRPTKAGGPWLTRFTQDGFEGDSVPIRYLLRLAFAPAVAPPDILNAPSFADSCYDIHARVSPDDLEAFQKYGADEHGLMIRSLLMQRFGLTFHYGSTTHEYLALVLATSKPVIRTYAAQGYSGLGTNEGLMPEGAGKLHFKASPDNMAHLARRLSWIPDAEHKLVVNETGLEGFYTFDLTWCAYSDLPVSGVPCDGPSFSAALKDELGLKLKPGRRAFESVIIDSIQAPTPN